MKKIDIQSEDHVTLRPVFGIKPTTYIPILYAVMLAVICFALFVLPGLIHNGSYLAIETTVEDAALWVDGTYMGSTSEPHFIAKGSHTLTIRKPYFEDALFTDYTVPGNIFFSLFHHKNVTLPVEMHLDDIDGYISWRLNELEKWAPIKEYSETYFYPEILTSAAHDLTCCYDRYEDAVKEFFHLSIAFITNDDMFSDLLQALTVLPEGLSDYIERLRSFTILREAYEDHDREAIQQYAETVIKRAEHTAASGLYDPVVIEGDRYLDVPFVSRMLLGSSDPFPELQYLPYVRDIEPFYLLNREVTEIEYAAFVEENPYWAKENIDQLLLDGVVDEEYLDQIDLKTPSSRPIRSISQTAASAFCDWYSSKLRSQGYQYEVSLPTEEQWETAALLYHADSSYTKRLLIVTQDGNDLFGMMGSVWEFTRSPYLPLENVLYADASDNPSLSHEIDLSGCIVKGGSFVNTDVFPYTKGVIDKSACSPYIGFRTVLREQKN